MAPRTPAAGAGPPGGAGAAAGVLGAEHRISQGEQGPPGPVHLQGPLQGHDRGGLVVGQGVPVPQENAVLEARPGLKHQGLKGQEPQNAVRDDNHPLVLLDLLEGLGQEQRVELLSLGQGKPVEAPG